MVTRRTEALRWDPAYKDWEDTKEKLSPLYTLVDDVIPALTVVPSWLNHKTYEVETMILKQTLSKSTIEFGSTN